MLTKRILASLLIAAILMLSVVLTAGAAAAPAIGTPENPTKIRVEVFDRGNIPEGKGTITDNRWTNFIHDEALKAGFDIEFVACPRDQEVEKLNVWMASDQAPDIVYTYDASLFVSYAEQGGIWDLSEYINQYPLITDSIGYLLPSVTYNDGVYALTGQSAPPASAPLKIRQDWLDILGLEVPTTPDELYTVLKAFKEQDPGNVGKDQVVPFALPAPGVVGTPGSYMDILMGFGVRSDATAFACLPGGNFDEATGTFRSPVDSPEAKEAYRFLNKLYQEGLIPREFAIDTSGDKYHQYVSSGVAGFVNCNAENINPLTIEAVPTVDWRPIDPLMSPDGTQMVHASKYPGMRMYIMVPKTCERPDEVVRYFNWWIENGINTFISDGFEGEHYNIVDGIKVVIDPDFKKVDIFNATDMNMIGFIGQEPVADELLAVQYPDARSAEIVLKSREIIRAYGQENFPDIAWYPRPVNQEKGAQLKKYIYEGAAKVIVATDFEAEYANYIAGWKQLGGDEYDAEIAAAIIATRAKTK